jgi:hypothetical protein
LVIRNFVPRKVHHHLLMELQIARDVSGWSEPTRRAVRARFPSFGTCSVREPLGLLELDRTLLTENVLPTS